MNRCLALIGAVLLATITVSSACMAAPSDLIHFTLEPERGNPATIHASFRKENGEKDRNDWSSGFMPSDLIGLEVSSFHSAGTRPIHFSVIREAGRLDCAGNGGNSHAAGNCSFTPDLRFEQMLVSHGIARPTREQSFGLTALNVRRDVVDAIASAGFPTPTVDQLMGLSALGVNGAYIGDIARAGYRPSSIQSLIEFKALGITGSWIRGFVQVGHAGIPPNELVQLKALNVTPEFIAGFDRLGYRDLPIGTLLQLKALGITPEFVRSAVGQRATMPPVNELVELRLFGPRGRP
ncbi:MAG: hypothetical protein ACTHOI_10505 [Sphingomicrobium sp.]